MNVLASPVTVCCSMRIGLADELNAAEKSGDRTKAEAYRRPFYALTNQTEIKEKPATDTQTKTPTESRRDFANDEWAEILSDEKPPERLPQTDGGANFFDLSAADDNDDFDSPFEISVWKRSNADMPPIRSAISCCERRRTEALRTVKFA